jgi:hypothetical protein
MLARVLHEIPTLAEAVVSADACAEPSYDPTSTGAADAVRNAGARTKRTARQARRFRGPPVRRGRSTARWPQSRTLRSVVTTS